MDPLTTWYVQRDGHALAYQAAGAGNSAVVWYFEIGLHPDLMWTDPHLHYLLDRIAAQSRTFDLQRRGLGMSDPVDRIPTLDEQAEDLIAVMDAEELDSAVVCGTGSTCGPCLLAAALHPDRISGLVLNTPLVEGLVRSDGTVPPGWEGHDLAGYVSGWQDAYDAWGSGSSLSMWDSTTNSPLNRRLMGLLERSAASPAVARVHLEWTLRQNLWDVLGSVQCTTRILQPGGSPRPQSVAQRIADAIPGATLHVLPPPNPAQRSAKHGCRFSRTSRRCSHGRTLGRSTSIVFSAASCSPTSSTRLHCSRRSVTTTIETCARHTSAMSAWPWTLRAAGWST
ncbi:alpha/beta fold hydrolase [Rhodococcoides kyotonense]|uniref:alpha/beta fold hydrolase n=1 Tax=Rhodococcoides kyotonense TaxID=398843 RepID=UPI000B2D12BF